MKKIKKTTTRVTVSWTHLEAFFSPPPPGKRPLRSGSRRVLLHANLWRGRVDERTVKIIHVKLLYIFVRMRGVLDRYRRRRHGHRIVDPHRGEAMLFSGACGGKPASRIRIARARAGRQKRG